MKTILSLEELAGEHLLDAIGFVTKQVETGYGGMEDANCIMFRLSGTTYMAVEDPDDGYRSSMEELLLIENPEGMTEFAPLPVIVVYMKGWRSGWNDKDMIMVLDRRNGKIIMEVGTDHEDDYYPSFVSLWQPENIAQR